MNHLLIAQIEKLPLEVQHEVERYVQSLTEQYVTPRQQPVNASVIAKRRQVFEKLDEKVFDAPDF